MSDSQPQPSRLLQFLPAVYSVPGNGDDSLFIGQYLKIFEKLLQGIDDAADLTIAPDGLDVSDSGRAIVAQRRGIAQLLDARVIGNLFYPRFSFLFTDNDSSFLPPLSGLQDDAARKALLDTLGDYIGVGEAVDSSDGGTTTAPIETWLSGFLQWLGTTVALDADKNWSIDQKRDVIARAPILQRARGTQKGMQWLINAWLNLPLDPQGPPAHTAGKLVPWKATVRSPAFEPVRVFDTDANGEPAFRLPLARPGKVRTIVTDVVCWAPSDASVRAYVPRLFEVNLGFARDGVAVEGLMLARGDDYAGIVATCRAVRDIVDEARPALTRYVVRTMPALTLGGVCGTAESERSISDLKGKLMSDLTSEKPTRPIYRDGMVLTAEHLLLEQSYHREKAALLNRCLYTDGVIGDGLLVSIHSGDPTAVEVTAGAAFDTCGRALVFSGTEDGGPRRVTFDEPGDHCYVYLVQDTESDGATQADTASLLFTADEDIEGARLAKLVLQDGVVKAVSIGEGDRKQASSRLLSPLQAQPPKEDARG